MYRRSKKNREKIRLVISRKRSQRLFNRCHHAHKYEEASQTITSIEKRVTVGMNLYRNRVFANVSNNKHRRSLVLGIDMPKNLRYLLHCPKSPFNLHNLSDEKYCTNGLITIPKNFSIIENEMESYDTICKIFSSLLCQKHHSISLDYADCKHLDLTTQVLLDAMLKDYIAFTNIVEKRMRNVLPIFTRAIQGKNINDEHIRRLIFSVGTPAVFDLNPIDFKDVEKYPLCAHDGFKEKDRERRMEQKDLDTSSLAIYVVNSLKRMHKKLTPQKREALCIVIGEILINAEEHSSTKYRYSIGYFQEENINGIHQGVFRLVILNFGNTIYDTFKNPQCKNKSIVDKMQKLSRRYTQNNFFAKSVFEEETLWTLYSLQDGVTSVSPQLYHRGNGSLRFIENFFSLKGTLDADSVSYLNICSGNTRIRFDGTYGIKTKTKNGKLYKIMSFNKSGSLTNKPDNKYVHASNCFFPGTIISTKILLNDDDITTI